jgi:transposase
MKTVELYARVRHAVLIEGISERAAADRFGINARTVSKMLKFSVPPGYVRKKPPLRPKLDEFTGVIDAILAADKDRPKKQRHTSKRIFERLRDEHGFTGKITIVKDYVAGWRQRTQEMFVPLVHPPGHAQADFGEAIGVIGGVERKIHFFAMDLPHSDAIFVVGYPAETTEAFCDGHVRARSRSSTACRSRSSMTTARSRLPAFSAMASVSARVCSASCNRTTCSRIDLAARQGNPNARSELTSG